MATPDKSVCKEFQKGLQTIYKALFQYIHLRFLDESRTVVSNVYDETYKKVYQKPIKLLGHYKRDRQILSNQDPIELVTEKEYFKIPVQEFIDHKLGYTTEEDIRKLKRAIIQFKGMTYQIDEVNPYSVVAGDYLMIAFATSPMWDYEPDKYDEFREKVIENA